MSNVNTIQTVYISKPTEPDSPAFELRSDYLTDRPFVGYRDVGEKRDGERHKSVIGCHLFLLFLSMLIDGSTNPENSSPSLPLILHSLLFLPRSLWPSPLCLSLSAGLLSCSTGHTENAWVGDKLNLEAPSD